MGPYSYTGRKAELALFIRSSFRVADRSSCFQQRRGLTPGGQLQWFLVSIRTLTRDDFRVLIARCETQNWIKRVENTQISTNKQNATAGVAG